MRGVPRPRARRVDDAGACRSSLGRRCMRKHERVYPMSIVPNAKRSQHEKKGALTIKRPAVRLRLSDHLREQLLRVVRHERQEPDPRRVRGRVREVPVVERDERALQKRVAEAPAEERARARRVGADDVARDARGRVVRRVLRDEVARVDGEELAADLEREAVRARAGEDGRLRGVGGVCGGDFGEDAADDVGRAADEGVALRGDQLSDVSRGRMYRNIPCR